MYSLYMKGTLELTEEEMICRLKAAQDRHQNSPYNHLWNFYTDKIDKDIEDLAEEIGDFRKARGVVLLKWKKRIRQEARNQ